MAQQQGGAPPFGSAPAYSSANVFGSSNGAYSVYGYPYGSYQQYGGTTATQQQASQQTGFGSQPATYGYYGTNQTITPADSSAGAATSTFGAAAPLHRTVQNIIDKKRTSTALRAPSIGSAGEKPLTIAALRSGDYPKSLQQFAERALQECKTTEQRKFTMAHIQKLVTAAKKRNTIWSKDWNKEALPDLSSGVSSTLPTQPSAQQTLQPVRTYAQVAQTGARFRNPSKPAAPVPPPPPLPAPPASQFPSSYAGGSAATSAYDPIAAAASTLYSSSKRSRDTSVAYPPTETKKQRNAEDAIERATRIARSIELETAQAKQQQRGRGKGGKGNEQTGKGKQKKGQMTAGKREKGNKGSGKSKQYSKEVMDMLIPVSNFNTEGEWDDPSLIIVGRSNEIERSYLRLTSAPDPNRVRPEHVLHQSLEHVKRRWREGCDYTYADDQMRAIRQDLRVQHIANEFTVRVYETHARMALEKSDINEFHRCQSQLQELYSLGIPGSQIEFKAYRILYCVFTNASATLQQILFHLSPEEKEEGAIKHALQVREAASLQNFAKLFSLYQAAPNMGVYVMDWMMHLKRTLALRIMCKAYRPTIPLDFITRMLVYDSERQAYENITAGGGVFTSREITDEKGNQTIVQLLDTKATAQSLKGLPALIEGEGRMEHH